MRRTCPNDGEFCIIHIYPSADFNFPALCRGRLCAMIWGTACGGLRRIVLHYIVIVQQKREQEVTPGRRVSGQKFHRFGEYEAQHAVQHPQGLQHILLAPGRVQANRPYTCSAVALSPPVTVQSISTKGGTYDPDKRLILSRHTSPDGRSMPCAISFSVILPPFPWCPIGAQPYKNTTYGDMTQYRLFLQKPYFQWFAGFPYTAL